MSCPKFLTCIISMLLILNMAGAQVLDTNKYKHYIDQFNKNYPEKIVNAIDNQHCWGWMCENIPFFDCPDKQLEEIYYYRWYVYRKHIKMTPAGYVVTEFLPNVSWAGKYNTISATASHHLYEGRWLRNHKYMNQYARFWFTGGSNHPDEVAWYANGGPEGAHETMTRKANETGVFDMTGNVQEWCSDWYSANYYKIAPLKNPQGPNTGFYRVVRGSGWFNKPQSLYVTRRFSIGPDYRYDDLGIRIVKQGNN